MTAAIAAQEQARPEQQEMPFAVVQGEPYTELPRDLYIPPDALEVILDAFEGPLDLLLYLIRRQNLDILDIPIAEITRQYMSYIDVMQGMQLELAGEYLVMAATLAEIKSRMLLPRPAAAGDEEAPERQRGGHIPSSCQRDGRGRPGETDRRGDLGEPAAPLVAQVVVERHPDLRLFLSGHSHINALGRLGGAHWLTASSFSESPFECKEIVVHDDRLTVRTVAMYPRLAWRADYWWDAAYVQGRPCDRALDLVL